MNSRIGRNPAATSSTTESAAWITMTHPIKPPPFSAEVRPCSRSDRQAGNVLDGYAGAVPNRSAVAAVIATVNESTRLSIETSRKTALRSIAADEETAAPRGDNRSERRADRRQCKALREVLPREPPARCAKRHLYAPARAPGDGPGAGIATFRHPISMHEKHDDGGGSAVGAVAAPEIRFPVAAGTTVNGDVRPIDGFFLPRARRSLLVSKVVRSAVQQSQLYGLRRPAAPSRSGSSSPPNPVPNRGLGSEPRCAGDDEVTCAPLRCRKTPAE